MWKYEIGLKKKRKKKKIGRTMTKQTSEGGKAKKITRDEELDCWFGAELSISFPPSVLMNVSSLLPPRFNYRSVHSVPSNRARGRAPVSSTVVKTFLESLERCPICFQRDPAANYSTSAHQRLFLRGEGAVAHLLTNSRPRRACYHSAGRSSLTVWI